MKKLLVWAVVLAGLAGGLWLTTKLQANPAPIQATLDLQDALSDAGGEFAEVVPGRNLHFPADHGEHPEFKTEWWYFTGTLSNDQGGEHGYQLTLFRTAVSPEQSQGEHPSEWAVSDILMGHFAVSDVNSGGFVSFERFSRRALGLAGVEPEARKIWLEDWSIEREASGTWRLRARQDRTSIDLLLEESKPVVLQGDQGYSRKGPESRHSSYYASITRLKTAGQLEFAGSQYSVKGLSWFDHEWSSAALAKGLVGWDWFSLHLDDGRELMLYLLRYEDGRVEPASSGTLVDAEGQKTNLTIEDFSVEVLDRHRAPSGVEYPSQWKIEVADLEIEVRPLLADQEMTTSIPYWEGAVLVEGSHQGRGFVEMTGYGKASRKG